MRCYLRLTPDDVVRVRVHSSMWRDRKMTFSAHVRQAACMLSLSEQDAVKFVSGANETRSIGEWKQFI